AACDRGLSTTSVYTDGGFDGGVRSGARARRSRCADRHLCRRRRSHRRRNARGVSGGHWSSHPCPSRRRAGPYRRRARSGTDCVARRRCDHARRRLDRQRGRTSDSCADSPGRLGSQGNASSRVSPIALPPDRRFRRAHVKPARMRRHWQTAAVRMAGYGLFIAVLLYAARRVPPILAQASLLQVDRIVVHGNERLSTDEVLTLLNGLRGQSLIATDLETWRLQMLSSPWVRTAELRRSLPSTVDVFLSEKEPLGIARVRGRMYLLDDGGGFIDEYGPHYAHFDLPIIDGLEAPSARAAAVNTPRVELVAQLLAALSPRPDIARRVSQIDVRDLHNVAVILTG